MPIDVDATMRWKQLVVSPTPLCVKTHTHTHTLARTQVASNGVEAVAAIRSGRQFDVVLMDMMMPVMNGVDSTREIRAMGHTRLPILAMVCGLGGGKASLSVITARAIGAHDI
eukprot:793643-Pelagomonas_calceolata.AAC.1